MGWAVTPRPGRFAPGKETRYTLYRRLSGPKGRSGRVRKISPPQGFLFLFWLSRILLLSSLTTHNTKIRALGGIFVFCFFFFLSLSFYPLCTFISFFLMSHIPLQHTTQTSMLVPGYEPAIPASDRPQALALDRSAIGIDRIRSPDRPTRSESLYRLSLHHRPL